MLFNNKKKHIIIIAITAILLFIGGIVTVSAEEVVLRPLRPGYPERDSNFWPVVVEAFQEEYPHITIEPMTGGWEIVERLTAMIAAGTEPDVYLINSDLLGFLVATESILPLDDYLSSSLKEEFMESHLRIATIDGNLYLLPGSPAPLGIWYNKELFNEAGLEPKAPENWDEFLEAAIQVTKNTDAYGFGLGSQHLRGQTFLFHSLWFSLTNMPLLDDEGRPLFNNEDGRRVLQFIVDLHLLHDVTQPHPEAWTRGELRVPFRDGQIAMHYDGPWILPMLKERFDFSEPDSQPFGMAPFPAGPKGYRSQFNSSDGWVVSANSKHPEEAIKLAMFLAQPEWNYLEGMVYGSSPATKSEHNMPGYEAWYWDWQKEALQLPAFDRMQPRQHTQAFDALGSAIQAAVLGVISVEEAIEQAATQLEMLR